MTRALAIQLAMFEQHQRTGYQVMRCVIDLMESTAAAFDSIATLERHCDNQD